MIIKKTLFKRAAFILKIVISIAILYFVFRKIEFHGLMSQITAYSIVAVVMLLLTSTLKHITQYYNWYWYLRINPNYQPNRWEVLKSYFIGLALSFVLPGGYATFGKMFFIENKKKATAVSVGVEKFYQTWIVLFFAGISSFYYFSKEYTLWKILAFAFVLVMPLLLPLALKLFKRQSRYPIRLFSITPRIILSQTVYTLVTFYQYYILLNNQVLVNSNSDITLFNTSICVSLILTVTLISITFNGLGIRETAAMIILPKYGINQETAVAASLMIFIFNAVIPAIAGAWLIFTHKKRLPNSEAVQRSES